MKKDKQKKRAATADITKEPVKKAQPDDTDGHLSKHGDMAVSDDIELDSLAPKLASATKNSRISQQPKKIETIRSRLAAIVESTDNAIISHTLKGTIQTWNPAAKRLFGYSADEIIGSSMDKLFPEDKLDTVLRSIDRINQGGHVEQCETKAVTKDGREIDVFATISHIRDDAGEVADVLWIVRQVNEGEQTATNLSHSNQQQDTLSRVARVLNSSEPLEDKVRQVLQELIRLVGANRAALRVPDQGASGLRLVAAVPADYEHSAMASRTLPKSSLSWRSFEDGTAIIVNDYEHHPEALPSFLKHGLRSVALVPIKAVGRTLGLISVDSMEANRFTPERIQLLHTISDELGVLLENARLMDTERMRTLELRSLLNMAGILSGHSDFDTKLKAILEEMAQMVEVDQVAFRILNEKDNTYRLLASAGTNQFMELQAVQKEGGLLHQALLTGESLIINDYPNHPKAMPHLLEKGLQSTAILPIKVGDHTLAVATVNSRQLNYFTAERVDVLAGIADGMAVLLENSGLLQQVDQAKQNLQETEAQYKAVVDNCADAISIVVGNRRVFVNKAFLEIYGLDDISQAIGSTLDRYILPEYRQQAKDRVARSARGESTDQRYDFQIRRQDGQVRTLQTAIAPIIYQGQPGGLAVIRDITEHKLAEEALQDSNRRLEEAVNNLELFSHTIASLDDGVVITDKNDDITFVNRGAERIFGYSIEELLGKNAKLLLSRKVDSELWKKVVEQTLEVGWQGELRRRRKNGEEFPSLVTFSPVRDEEGKIVGMVGVTKDITERKQMEEALQVSNSQLQQALMELKEKQQETIQTERLLALGQLASGIAHDFNNSLMPILGFSELLLARPESLNDKDKVVERLRMINTAAKDAAETIGRLRQLYRFRNASEAYRPVSINNVVAQAISLTQTKWKDEAEAGGIVITLETDLQDALPVLGNESELRDVVTNLIFNAVDAMPNGGTLTIRTRADEEHVVLEVIDTGTGMTEEVRQRCLEPFFTTKGDRGTGMGLAVVAGAIKRHDGTMQIKSELGKGTAFIIRLPVTQQAIEEDDEDGAVTLIRSLHILVVDDEPAVRKVVAEYLTVDGHTVETACDGREALDKFTSGKFDLVVTDRAMPRVSGDQLATAIKTIAPRPVILLTGFGDIMKSKGEKPAGVNMILRKPVTLFQLRDSVAKVMAR